MAKATIHAAGESPSATIINNANKVVEVVGPTGRKYKLRKLSPLHRMQAFRALGNDLSQNLGFLTYSLVALSVSEIDGEKMPMPGSDLQFEARVSLIGDDWDAVSEALGKFDVSSADGSEAQAAKN